MGREFTEERENAAVAIPEPVEVEEPSETIEVAEDEEADDPDEPPATRAARRQERGRKWREDYDRRLKEAEERAQAAELRAAQAQGYMAAQQQGPPRQEQQDPDEAALEEVRARKKEMWELWQANGARMSKDEILAFEKRAQQINDYERDIGTRLSLKRAGVGPQVPPQVIAAQARAQAAIQTHAADLMAAAQKDPRVARYAQAEWAKLVHGMGLPDNEETLVLAAEATRKQFGMESRMHTRRQAPPKHTTTGIGAGSRGGAPSPTRVVMTDTHKRIAESMYSDLEPEDAHKKWAQGPGLRAQKRLNAGEGVGQR